MKIPQGQELQGKNKAFDFRRTLNLAFGEHKEDFGVAVDHPVTDESGKVFKYSGWIGGEYGKTEPVLIEFNENPGLSADQKELPAMRIYVAVDGALNQVAALWKKTSNATSKPFYAGKLGSSDLVAFPYEKRTQEGAPAQD